MEREPKILVFGIMCIIIGTYLVVLTTGWVLWFGIMFLSVANNISQRNTNDENYKRKGN